MRRRRKWPVTPHNGNLIRHLPTGTFMADFNWRGTRKRRCFDTLAQAKTKIDEWKTEAANKGREALGLADRDRLDVTEARKKLGTVRLSTVFDFWFTHHPTGEQKTVEQIVDEFLDAPGRRGTKTVQRREATTEGHRKRLQGNEGAFAKVFGAHKAHEVAQGDIQQWLDVNKWTGLNRRHYLATVKALFAFAVRKKYVAINPAAEIEMPAAETAEPVIMTVGDVEKYLHAIETTVKVTRNAKTGVEYRVECADMLPREAIAFFCGLRPEELSRLDWRNVSVENKLITVSGDVAKVQGHRRNVEMPDNLIAWLAPYVRPSGPVWPYSSPTTLLRKRKEARTAAELDVPDNAGRHAFASYHLAAYENAAKTAELMGHADVKLLKNTYRNIVASDGKAITKAAGETFFKIMPKREKKELRIRATA